MTCLRTAVAMLLVLLVPCFAAGAQVPCASAGGLHAAYGASSQHQADTDQCAMDCCGHKSHTQHRQGHVSGTTLHACDLSQSASTLGADADSSSVHAAVVQVNPLAANVRAFEEAPRVERKALVSPSPLTCLPLRI